MHNSLCQCFQQKYDSCLSMRSTEMSKVHTSLFSLCIKTQFWKWKRDLHTVFWRNMEFFGRVINKTATLESSIKRSENRYNTDPLMLLYLMTTSGDFNLSKHFIYLRFYFYLILYILTINVIKYHTSFFWPITSSPSVGWLPQTERKNSEATHSLISCPANTTS